MAFTSCTSSISTVGTSASSMRHEFAVAQIDLLEIRVEPARRGTGRCARRSSSGSSGTCESSAAMIDSAAVPDRRQRADPRPPAPSSVRACAGMSRSAAVSAAIMCA